MPNWCNMELRIKKDVADEYLLSEVDGKPTVDFEKMIPMPDSIRNTKSGSNNDAQVYLYVSDKLSKEPGIAEISQLFDIYNERSSKFYPFDKWMGSARESAQRLVKDMSEIQVDKEYETGKQLVENYKEYGSTDWYEWAVKNWGTKWNAGECELEYDGDHVIINFSCAYNPPMEILEKLAKHGDFYMDYDIEGNGYGSLEAKKGKIHDLGFKELDYEYEER